MQVWAEGKRKAGWQFAPLSNGGTESDKTSPMLVPYEFLDEKEKVSELVIILCSSLRLL
jgi:hypothetical protein